MSFGAKLSALFTPGSHGSIPFAGNPLGAAAFSRPRWRPLRKTVRAFNAEARGQQLQHSRSWLASIRFVSVRGRLLDAVELAHPCAHAAMNWALEHGLIVNAVAPDALRLAPPLVVTEQDIDQAISILAKIPTDLPND
ncbi:MAG: aminotransferase class III-fold pyridoxal phosphate-dependent enzyme [Bifidobacterium pseudocatenulatum]